MKITNIPLEIKIELNEMGERENKIFNRRTGLEIWLSDVALFFEILAKNFHFGRYQD